MLIEVDLTGQVCSDSIGTRIYSGFGGQVDFVPNPQVATQTYLPSVSTAPLLVTDSDAGVPGTSASRAAAIVASAVPAYDRDQAARCAERHVERAQAALGEAAAVVVRRALDVVDQNLLGRGVEGAVGLHRHGVEHSARQQGRGAERHRGDGGRGHHHD